MAKFFELGHVETCNEGKSLKKCFFSILILKIHSRDEGGPSENFLLQRKSSFLEWRKIPTFPGFVQMDFKKFLISKACFMALANAEGFYAAKKFLHQPQPPWTKGQRSKAAAGTPQAVSESVTRCGCFFLSEILFW